MSQARLQGLLEEQVTNTIVEVETALRETKTKQFMAGASILFRQYDSGLQYDWSGVIPVGPQTAFDGSRILRYTVKAETAGVLFMDVIAELYVGNPTNLYTAKNSGEDANNSNTFFDLLVFETVSNDSTRLNETTFEVVIFSHVNQIVAPSPTLTAFVTPCYLKLYLIANDRVTITDFQVRR